jgi:hypothetical protein
MPETTPVREVKAQKRHRCTWCPEIIEKGTVYKTYTSFSDGDVCRQRFHPECLKAAEVMFAKEGWYEWDCSTNTRGCICEAGDPGHGTYKDCIKL